MLLHLKVFQRLSHAIALRTVDSGIDGLETQRAAAPTCRPRGSNRRCRSGTPVHSPKGLLPLAEAGLHGLDEPFTHWLVW